MDEARRDLRRALELVRKIALDHAQREGVVHREVKPSNIIVDTCGELHLTDFRLLPSGRQLL